MTELTLAAAQALVSAALAHGREKTMQPLAVAVLDARGALRAFGAEDGTSLKRGDIARGKASGAIALGVGSRALHRMAQERPHFIESMHGVVGALVPVPGGVLLRDASGAVIGAVGISGDNADNDEAAALAGAAAVGLTADPGK